MGIVTFYGLLYRIIYVEAIPDFPDSTNGGKIIALEEDLVLKPNILFYFD